MTRQRMRVLWLLAFLSVTGCGGAEPLVPVAGTITVDGKPLAEGVVVFHPDIERGNATQQEPRGRVTAQGVYELRSGDRTGAPPGWYKVAVFAMKQPKPGDGLKPPEWLAAPKYRDENTSGLRVRVVEGAAAGAYDFVLKP